MGNIFETAKRILKSRRGEPAFDWRNDAAKREYIREKKRRDRISLLQEIVPDYRCPICGEVKLESRKWVIIELERITQRWDSVAEKLRKIAIENKSALCRSCAMKNNFM